MNTKSLAPIALLIGRITVGGLGPIVGGLSLITGVMPRIGVGIVVLFLVPVSLFMHNFWAVQGLEQTIELASFMKNMALAASALMYLAIPEPWAYSLKLSPKPALATSAR